MTHLVLFSLPTLSPETYPNPNPNSTSPDLNPELSPDPDPDPNSKSKLDPKPNPGVNPTQTCFSTYNVSIFFVYAVLTALCRQSSLY